MPGVAAKLGREAPKPFAMVETPCDYVRFISKRCVAAGRARGARHAEDSGER